MRPRVPGSRRGKNPSIMPSVQVQQRSQCEETLGNFQGMTNIASGYSDLVAQILPLLSLDGNLTFEIIIFAFMNVALFLQYLHLYRSVWWLPHSYNSNAVNFYLIDPVLMAFSITILARRLVWTIIKKILNATLPPQWVESFVTVIRSLLTLLIVVALLIMTYYILQKHPIVNILYLAYPVSMYFLLFGLSGEPFLELIPETSNGKHKPSINGVKIYQDKAGVYHCSSPCPMPINPESVRNEIQTLKIDFNARLKQVLFNSMVSSYYAAFIPCCFAPSALNYETAWVFRHGLLVFVGGGILYSVQIFPTSYIHMLHRTAVRIGQWTKIEGRISHAFYNQWNPNTVWPNGSFVRHGKDLYRADGMHNCAEPGNLTQSRFYSYFNDPISVLGVLLMVQSGLVLAQHLSLAWSVLWYQLISEAILLFANYYALFKLTRDYLVFWKMSPAEKGKDS